MITKLLKKASQNQLIDFLQKNGKIAREQG